MSLGQKTFNTVQESLEGESFKLIEESLQQVQVGDQKAFGYLYNEIVPCLYVGLKELS